MSLREKLLNAVPERKRQDVTELLPEEWQAALGGARVYVRDMSAGERTVYLKEIAKDGATMDDLAHVLICLVDDSGNRVFEPKDRAELERKLTGAALIRLKYAAAEVCGFLWQPPSPSANGRGTGQS